MISHIFSGLDLCSVEVLHSIYHRGRLDDLFDLSDLSDLSVLGVTSFAVIPLHAADDNNRFCLFLVGRKLL